MSRSDLERYLRNYKDEVAGAAMYASLAEAEKDPVREDLFRQLADAEHEHAELWHIKLVDSGAKRERGTHRPQLNGRARIA
jgi:rubrerythrin